MTDVPRFMLARIARRLEILAALARERRTSGEENADAMQEAAEELRKLARQEATKP